MWTDFRFRGAVCHRERFGGDGQRSRCLEAWTCSGHVPTSAFSGKLRSNVESVRDVHGFLTARCCAVALCDTPGAVHLHWSSTFAGRYDLEFFCPGHPCSERACHRGPPGLPGARLNNARRPGFLLYYIPPAALLSHQLAPSCRHPRRRQCEPAAWVLLPPVHRGLFTPVFVAKSCPTRVGGVVQGDGKGRLTWTRSPRSPSLVAASLQRTSQPLSESHDVPLPQVYSIEDSCWRCGCLSCLLEVLVMDDTVSP